MNNKGYFNYFFKNEKENCTRKGRVKTGVQGKKTNANITREYMETK